MKQMEQQIKRQDEMVTQLKNELSTDRNSLEEIKNKLSVSLVTLKDLDCRNYELNDQKL